VLIGAIGLAGKGWLTWNEHQAQTQLDTALKVCFQRWSHALTHDGFPNFEHLMCMIGQGFTPPSTTSIFVLQEAQLFYLKLVGLGSEALGGAERGGRVMEWVVDIIWICIIIAVAKEIGENCEA
jgi:hypothetical protein